MKTLKNLRKDRVLQVSFATCHVAYFAGVGAGVHELSSYGAIVILLLMAVARVLHVHLEG